MWIFLPILVAFDYQKDIQRYNFCCLKLKSIVKKLVESCLQKGNLWWHIHYYNKVLTFNDCGSVVGLMIRLFLNIILEDFLILF